MNPTLLIVLTAGLVIVRVVRLLPLLRSAPALAPGRHPVVLLVGSLLSLMALYSVLRYVPAEATSSWPLFFHVGFICLWLLLLVAPADSRPSAGEGAPALDQEPGEGPARR